MDSLKKIEQTTKKHPKLAGMQRINTEEDKKQWKIFFLIYMYFRK